MPANPSLDMRQASRRKDAYFEGAGRYQEPVSGLTVVNVHAGDCFVSSKAQEVGSTVLGSCVSACIRDPVIGLGGMNHFLLPNARGADALASARFGAFAMEQLINEILKRGGVKKRLEVKLFGGGNVIESSLQIGDVNARFALEYVHREGLQLISYDLGGDYPRRLRYFPASGKALLRRLRRLDDYQQVRREERQHLLKLHSLGEQGDIELF